MILHDVHISCLPCIQFKIRREALLGLGNIYKTVMSKDPVDPQEAARVDWIRNKVFHHYYQNSNDDRYEITAFMNMEDRIIIRDIFLKNASLHIIIKT